MKVANIQNNGYHRILNTNTVFGKKQNTQPKQTSSRNSVDVAHDAATCSLLLSLPFLLNSRSDRFTAAKATGLSLVAISAAAETSAVMQRIKLKNSETINVKG